MIIMFILSSKFKSNIKIMANILPQFKKSENLDEKGKPNNKSMLDSQGVNIYSHTHNSESMLDSQGANIYSHAHNSTAKGKLNRKIMPDSQGVRIYFCHINKLCKDKNLKEML